MTAAEMADVLDQIQTAVDALTADPRDWDREQIDDAIGVWDRLDRLATSAQILRRDHAVVLARRLPDEYTAGPVTVHRTVEKTEAWDGHAVIADIASPVINADGERIDAVPVEILRDVLPACGQGAVSSKWKRTSLDRIDPEIAKQRRTVTYGDNLIARGPLAYQARRRASRADTVATETGDAPG